MQAIRRLLWVLLTISIMHLTISLGCAVLVPPAPVPGPLLAPTGGPLRTLAIQFHRPAADQFLPVFGQILQTLDPDTVVHVVVSDEADRALFESAYGEWFPAGEGPAVEYAYTDRPITSWMRDRLAVLGPAVPGAPTMLLAPDAPMTGPEARVHDWTVPWTLGDHLGDDFQVHATRYRFDGGDLIADSERVYVATPLFERNPDADPEAIIAELEDDLGLPVLRLGADGHAVPSHHIGMFLTPLGDGRVAVGSPDLAIDALTDRDALPEDGVIRVGGAPLALDLSEARLDRFRRVTLELEAAGVEVVPIPILPSRTPFVFMSANNVLVERRDDGLLHVYLPTYGVPAFDETATEAWEDAGAVVHPILVDEIFRLGGSVRCLVAPLEIGT